MAMPFHNIRISRGKGAFADGLTVQLPQILDDGVRLPNQVYVADLIEYSDERHVVIGKFLQEWGNLENSLNMLMATLLNIDKASSRAIFNGLGMKQIIDTLFHLSTLKLTNDLIAELQNLTERLSKLNNRRNIIVHGRWIFEVIVFEFKGVPQVRTHNLRCAEPSDDRLRDKIADPKNQKERIKYCMNFKRIQSSTRDSQSLLVDFGKFCNKISAHNA